MKVKNNNKTTFSLADYCSLYIDKFNAHQLTRAWQHKAAFAAATATVATGLFLGTASSSNAQITCAPAFVEAPSAIPVTNPGAITAIGDVSRTHLVDYDGDGDYDLFSGEKLGTNVTYFKNTGTNAAPVWAAGQVNPNGLTIAQGGRAITLIDINGDGAKDVFIGTVNSGLIYLRNTGTNAAPTYAAPVVDPFGINTGIDSYLSPTFADVDNDGDFDLMIGEKGGNLRFQRNTGTATVPAFGAVVTNPFGSAGVGTYSTPAFSDLDGDGDLDLMVGAKPGNFNYFKNTGTAAAPAFAGVVSNPFDLNSVASSSSPTFADLDNDGDLDMFSGDKGGNATYFKNGGTATQADFLKLAYNMPLVDGGAYPAFVDIDGDGDKDAFFGQQTNGSFIFAPNTGTAQSPNFGTPLTNPFGIVTTGTYGTPSFADLDNDGDYDIISSNNTGNLFYFQNTGSRTAPAFAAPITNPFGLVGATAGTFGTPKLVDMDGDGDMDIVVGGGSGNTSYFQNTGSRTAPAFAAAVINPFGIANVGAYSSPAFVDVDGDGDLDAFVGNNNSVSFFANNGTRQVPNFGAPTVNPFGMTVSGAYLMPYLVDINGDGTLDLFIGQTSGVVSAFENSTLLPTISVASTGNLTDCGNETVKAIVGNYASNQVTVKWYNALTNVQIATGIEFNPEALNVRGSYYAVVVTNGGCRAVSTVSNYAPVVPSSTFNLTAQAGYNTANLNWTRNGECDAPVQEYEVYADPGGFGSYFLLGYSSTTNYEAVGLINGEKVTFRIRPIYTNGTYGLYSNLATVKPSIILGEEDNAKAGFAFFPNPNNGEFNLKLQDGSVSATVSVTSLSGQRVYTTTLNATQTSINLGNIASGMYIVNVETAQGTYQQKVSIVR